MQNVPVNLSASGATTVIGGVTGKRIRVLGMALFTNGASQTVTVQDTGSNVLIGPTAVGSSGFVLPIAPPVVGSQVGWCVTTSQGQGLVLNLGAAAAVGGVIVYDLVP